MPFVPLLSVLWGIVRYTVTGTTWKLRKLPENVWKLWAKLLNICDIKRGLSLKRPKQRKSIIFWSRNINFCMLMELQSLWVCFQVNFLCFPSPSAAIYLSCWASWMFHPTSAHFHVFSGWRSSLKSAEVSHLSSQEELRAPASAVTAVREEEQQNSAGSDVWHIQVIPQQLSRHAQD